MSREAEIAAMISPSERGFGEDDKPATALLRKQISSTVSNVLLTVVARDDGGAVAAGPAADQRMTRFFENDICEF